MEKQLKGAIYARVSSLGNRQDTARQVDDLNAYAATNNIEIQRTFTEKASGAKERSERPVLNECLTYCVTNKIDILLVNELSCLGRNTLDLIHNVTFAKDKGLNIFFQKEQFNIFTQDGKPHPFLLIFISIFGTIAEMESENIKYRLNSGRDRYIREGGKLGRKRGYKKPASKYYNNYPEVFKELRRPNRESFDRIARLCNVSKRTVMTCRDILEGRYEK